MTGNEELRLYFPLLYYKVFLRDLGLDCGLEVGKSMRSRQIWLSEINNRPLWEFHGSNVKKETTSS